MMANSLVNLFLLCVLLPVSLSIESFCSLMMDEGQAVEGMEDKQQLQYYYDNEKKICQPFFYKGLKGNQNRFNTDRECMRNCSDNFEQLYPDDDAVCKLDVDHGSCYAMMLMYYYNKEEKNCRIFHYGGCQGNGNRFQTRDECLQTCMAKSGRLAGANVPNPDENTTDAGLIVGIVGGILFVVAVISAVAFMVVQRKEKSRNRKKESEKEPALEMS